jgi:5-methyltetrahydropteroyltriglutamate--homocysteine methyltransferase
VDIVSDGEFGKPSWLYLTQRVSGFEIRMSERRSPGFLGAEREGRFAELYDETGPLDKRGQPFPRAVCVGPVVHTETGRAQMRRDIANFKAALKKVAVEEAFLPVVAPCSMWVDYENEHYKTEEEFPFAVADALHEDYQAIVDAGLIVQVDDAILTNLYDRIRSQGRDYRKWVAMNIEALNHGLRGIPEDRVRSHLCWGSWPGPHTSDVPLRKIVDLLVKVNAQAYSIEAANPRHEHERQVWEDVKLPDGKILLPGVVSHAIAQRITRFANILGRENVIASTDCGFAQASAVARQHPSIVWAKLEAMAEGARIAWREKVRV